MLDLTEGYYQVPVHIKDWEKTAFIMSYGKYEFITMPFGLISAPSTFQRLMDGLLNGLHNFMVAYLDDIIVHSSNWKEHMQHLEIVFNRLREAGLTVKERKCVFGCGTCVYLGHVVGGGTIKPMECKVIAVKVFQQPQSKKDVRAFLGLCGYYRKFIKQFSTIATPLTELTRKSMTNKVKWDSRCEKTFSMLKSLLTRHLSYLHWTVLNPSYCKLMPQKLDWDMLSIKLIN